jgi:hypothetical protein
MANRFGDGRKIEIEEKKDGMTTTNKAGPVPHI